MAEQRTAGLPSSRPIAEAVTSPVDDTLGTGRSISQVLRDFRLVEKLGEGGMGIVYRAHQISMDRSVALKILPPQLAADQDFVGRFYREARMSAKLDHPNVVRGVAVGEEAGVYYFAMEFVDGESLDKILARLGKLAIGDAVRIILDVARALDHASSRGMIHRDIKPANILITREGVVKLADLGLAKMTNDDSGLTHAGGIVGTPSYMAPEQAGTDQDVDIRCDIYALGATLYHLVSGRKPFTGTSLDILRAKEKGKYESLRKVEPSIPATLDKIVDRMLALRPADRFQTPAELIAGLESTGLAAAGLSWLGGAEPTVVSSATARTATVAAVPVRRMAPWLLLVALLALLAAGGVWWMTRETPTPLPAPAREPAPPPEVEKPKPAASADQYVGKALAAVMNDDVAEARAVLSRAREDYPDSSEIGRLSRELQDGALVLLQYQKPDRTSAPTPLWEVGNLSLTQADNYRFAIAPSRDCFFYVFQADQRPSISSLFPGEGKSTRGHPLAGGQRYWLPEPSAEGRTLWLHLDERPGQEWVYIVGLTRPLRDPVGFSKRLLAEGEAVAAALKADLGSFVGEGGAPPSPCFTEGAMETLTFMHR